MYPFFIIVIIILSHVIKSTQALVIHYSFSLRHFGHLSEVAEKLSVIFLF